jgi:lipopolysaccharide/colanic/teichoic acid biosynthesis glycosyltransferase
MSRALKRAVDIGAAAFGLLLLSPLLALVAIAVRLSMGSPVLFRHVRPGWHGRPFTLLKFRTMRDARPDEVGPEHDAARMTVFGSFMRKLSIDELPQLWNVLRGDMSLIGPRPLLMQYLGRYSPEQARRHEVRPGMTGWAQVKGRNATDWEQRMSMDVWYVDHWSLVLDFRIFLMTLAKLVRREGISQAGHATMPEFMGSGAAEPSNRTSAGPTSR